MGIKSCMDFNVTLDGDNNGSLRSMENQAVKKIRFYKRLVIEVVETLITICMVLSRDTRGSGRYRNILEDHITELGKYSYQLRIEQAKK